MRMFKILALLFLVVGLAGCSSKFKTYNGPEVTQVLISKSSRKMYLLHHEKVLKAYPIDLGFAPDGHKMKRGDGRTPEGAYLIDRRNPNSSFHLSLGISYPNAADRLRAKMEGVDPGGDIFIHGQPNEKKRGNGRDWTAGCISIKDRHMEDAYAMVRDGTPVMITP